MEANPYLLFLIKPMNHKTKSMSITKITRLPLLLAAFFPMCILTGNAQQLTLPSGASTLGEVFQTVESQASYHFVVSEDDLDLEEPITLPKENWGLEELMAYLSTQSNLDFNFIDESIVVRPATGSSWGKAMFQWVKGTVTDAE